MDRLEATQYAGQVNAAAIEYGFKYAIPGTSLIELDQAIEDYILTHNCKPVFKGYKGFPASCCLSPNDVVVHGVPSFYILREGDILTIDVGSSFDGWMVDSARTRSIGKSNAFEALINGTESILQSQIDTLREGTSLLDIVRAGMAKAKELNLNLYPQYGGHLIGRELHIEPCIPNVLESNITGVKRQLLEREYSGFKLKRDQVICLEPVTTFGNTDIMLDADGWSARSKDGSIASHTERCIRITEKGSEIIS